MKCPSCEYEDSKVIDSRPTDNGDVIRRRRECLKCGYRFTTYERIGHRPVIVLKSDGSSEPFNREKLARGLHIACAKRPTDAAAIESLIDEIESEFKSQQITEITSKDLGEIVLSKLLDIDEVAYIRFASVYRDFQNVEEFSEALSDIC